MQAVSMGTQASTVLTRLPRAARRLVGEELTTTKQLLTESFDLAVRSKQFNPCCVFVCFVSLWNL